MRKTKGLMVVAALLAAQLSGLSRADEVAVPALDHVFLIMMENHSYQDIIGNDDAPFINQFAQSANLATNYFAVGHPSLVNYLEVVGGSNFGVQNDDYPDWHGEAPNDQSVPPIAGEGTDRETPAMVAPFGLRIPAAHYTAQTIADQLDAHGKHWKTYQESLPPDGTVDGVNYSDGIFSNLDEGRVARLGGLQKFYAAKHNPFVYFASVQENTHHALENVVGFDGAQGLYADLGAGTVPEFSFIVPNHCHDMHGMSNSSKLCADKRALVQMGDVGVRQLVESIQASPAWKTGHAALIVMWDENSFGAEPNRVPMMVYTNYGTHGVQSNRPYSHFSLLKTLETAFGLPCLNHACDSNVHVMTDLFATGQQ